jgi:outer membrane protein
MNKSKFLPVLNSVLIIGLALFCAYMVFNKKEAIVYADSVKLFNGFEMTNEMRAIGENKMKEKRTAIDSLIANYQSLEDKESDASKSLQNRIVLLNKELQQFQQSYFNSVNDQISDRLDAYMKEFGKAKGLKIILGSNVLYAEDSIEITDEALQYINQRYNGLQLK